MGYARWENFLTATRRATEAFESEIAFAQNYFAAQTRKQELIEERMRLQARLAARDRLRESEKTFSSTSTNVASTTPVLDAFALKRKNRFFQANKGRAAAGGWAC